MKRYEYEYLECQHELFLFLPQQGYTHSIPNTLLAQTAQSARELDFQYSPFPVAQSMQSRNSNNASSLGGQSISMPEVIIALSLRNTRLNYLFILAFIQKEVVMPC